MTIRPATLADLPALLRMSASFVEAYNAQTGAGLAMNQASVLATLEHLIVSDGYALVAVNPEQRCVGMLLATIYSHPVTGELTASELALWIDPPARGRVLWRLLLRAYVAWATGAGATVIQMAALDKRAGLLFEKEQFRATETTYQRRVA